MGVFGRKKHVSNRTNVVLIKKLQKKQKGDKNHNRNQIKKLETSLYKLKISGYLQNRLC